jgi:hypothetical protein
VNNLQNQLISVTAHRDALVKHLDAMARRLHPDYGPCDGLADDGSCSECVREIERLRAAPCPNITGNVTKWCSLAAGNAEDAAAVEQIEAWRKAGGRPWIASDGSGYRVFTYNDDAGLISLRAEGEGATLAEAVREAKKVMEAREDGN